MSAFIEVAAEAAARAPVPRGLVFFASIVFAFSTSLCAAQQSAATYPVAGVVEDSLTHQPIARALVESSSHPEAVLTDSEGRFALQLPAGFTNLQLRRPGYAGDRYRGELAMRAINVSANMPPLTLFLTPSAGITGHVTLSTGDQADGLNIALYRKRISGGESHWEQAGMATSGSDGTFRFLSLEAPGSYVLCSTASPDRLGLAISNAPEFGYPGTCFPGATDLASAMAAPLKLAAGQQQQLEISLARQPFYPVSISVATSEQNRSMPQVFDHSGRPAGMGFMMGGADSGRGFEISLPSGSYYAEAHTWGKTQSYGRLDFTVAGAPLSGLTMVPVPVRPITVEVRKEFTANQNQNSRVFIINGVPQEAPLITGVSLTPVDKPLAGLIGTNLRKVQSSPTDEIDEIDIPTPDTYWIRVNGYQSYVSSMTSSGTDLLREPLKVGPGGTTAPIEITLRNDMGSLVCHPKSASGPGVDPVATQESLHMVNVIPLSPNQQRIYFAPMQAFAMQAQAGMGNFALPLPPGNYLVVAFAHDREIDLDDPSEISRLVSEGQTVTIQPGATTEIQVDPIPVDAQEAAQ